MITAGDCLDIIDTLEQAAKPRAHDRALISAQFNGSRPYTDAEVEEFQIQVNANFLEGYKVAMDGNLQVNGALLNKRRLFHVRCKAGKVSERDEFGRIVTELIHAPIVSGRSGLKHYHLMRNRNASLVLHGIGAMVWHNPYDWMPKFVALDDLLVPSDASQDLSDGLGHFAVNSWMTPLQLYRLVSGSKVDRRWNVRLAKSILADLKSRAGSRFEPDVYEHPEKVESLWKQHSAYMASDAVPKIKITFFYHQNEETGAWHRKVVARDSDALGPRAAADVKSQFLYDGGDDVFADDISQILHVQFGDGSVSPPLKFHSVRGLGVLLYSPVEVINRLRCQQMQHTFEQMMQLLRVQSPSDRDRPRILHLHPYAVVEEGVSFVTPQERHQADPRMIEFSMAQAKQLIAENSSAYVADIDTGTRKEQTLGEAQIKLQSANRIISGMLSTMYLQESFYYQEILRRFMLSNSTDAQVAKFRADCAKRGVPEELLQAENFDIEVERVLGAGDQTLAVQEASQLLAISPSLAPSARRVVQRMYVSSVSRNDDLARILVPDGEPAPSRGVQAAESVFGTLMAGAPVSLREGIEHEDYIVTMLSLAQQVVAQIHESGGVGTRSQVVGLAAVIENIQAHLDVLSSAATNKQFVAEAGAGLSRLANEVRAFYQRQQEAGVGEAENIAQTKAQAALALAQQRMAINQQKFEQKMAQDAERHEMEMRQIDERIRAQSAAAEAKALIDALKKSGQP